MAVQQNAQGSIGVLTVRQAEGPIQKDAAAFRGGDSLYLVGLMYQAFGVQFAVISVQ